MGWLIAAEVALPERFFLLSRFSLPCFLKTEEHEVVGVGVGIDVQALFVSESVWNVKERRFTANDMNACSACECGCAAVAAGKQPMRKNNTEHHTIVIPNQLTPPPAYWLRSHPIITISRLLSRVI